MKCPKCTGWMMRAGPLGKSTWHCVKCSFELGPNVSWIINVTVDDVNYTSHLPRLTDEELEFCLKMETRVSSLQRLRGEKRRRERAQKKKGTP